MQINYCIVLYCIVLYCIVLYCIVSHSVLVVHKLLKVNLTMNFTEPQNSTIQERQIDLSANKLEYLAFYNSGKAETSSYERVLINIESYTFVFGRILFSEKI